MIRHLRRSLIPVGMALGLSLLFVTDHAAAQDAAGAAAAAAPSGKPEDSGALPAEHEPKLSLKVDPAQSVKLGGVVHVVVKATVPLGDDVTVADQSFAPFEVYKKQARVEPPPPNGASQTFVFTLELLALEPGELELPAIQLRVVTKDNQIGTVRTEPRSYKVQSLLANEPNAQPKLETKPVVVLQDNYLPIYIAEGVLAAAAVAALTLLIARYLRRRKAAAVPPPPPRPPWEIAIERLAELKQRKQAMLDAGQGAAFVEQLSHVVRDYLGGRYAFDGLETTTAEMLKLLQARGASLGFTHEVGQFLGRSDLVKFAKVEPDTDEVDLLFSKAQDLVNMSEPERTQPTAANGVGGVGDVPSPGTPAAAVRPSQAPNGGGPVA